MEKDFFEEYIKHTEPEKKEKAYAWSIGIGLQDVDGIKPSKYLIETAKKKYWGRNIPRASWKNDYCLLWRKT